MNKHFFVGMAKGRKRGKTVHNPDTAGRLVDHYLGYLETSSVIDNYLLNYSTLTEEEKEELHDLKITKALHLREAKEIYSGLPFPPWKRLAYQLKHAYKIAACAAENDGVALTSNLGPAIACAALASADGPVLYLARKVRKILDELELPLHFAMVLEFAADRNNNHPLHFHASLSIPEHLKGEFRKRLHAAVATGYIGGSKRAVHYAELRTPGGWAAYCMGDLENTKKLIDDPMYSTHPASQLGEALYNRTCKWLRTEAKSFTDKTLSDLLPGPKPGSAPELEALIKAAKRARKERQLLGRQLNARAKKQAKENPDLFRQQLAIQLFGCATEQMVEKQDDASGLFGLTTASNQPSECSTDTTTPAIKDAQAPRYQQNYDGDDHIGLWGS